MKTNSVKRASGILVAALMVLTPVVSGIAAIPSFAEGEESRTGHKLTLKLNGGQRASGTDGALSGADVEFLASDDKLTLTHDKVHEMFGNISPFLYENGKYMSEERDGKGLLKYSTPLLYGLFEDANNDGQLNEGEALYLSGDTLTLNGDKTLTCYYADNGFVYSEAGWGMDSSAYVSLGKGWKEGHEPVNNQEEKLSFYARDMQPLYMKVGSISDNAFSTGGWCNAIEYVSVPTTVEVIGYQAFRNAFGLERLDGLENVYGLDAEALMGTRLSEITFSNINYFAHYSMTLDAPSSKLIVEKWQNDKTPQWYAPGRMADSNPAPWFGVNNPSLTQPNGYIYVPAGKTVEWYTADPNNQLKLSRGSDWSGSGGNDVEKYQASLNIPMREMYTVKFDLNGGRGIVYNEHQDAGAVSVTKDGTELNLTSYASDGNQEQLTCTNEAARDLSLLNIRKPENPTNGTLVFLGWKDSTGYIWKDGDFGENGKVLEQDELLTAQWGEEATVTFNYNNGTDNEVNTVAKGSYLSRPEDPIASAGYYFDAWYKDEALTQAWNFETDTVAGDMTLFAGYTAFEYTITYKFGDGRADETEKYTVENSVTLSSPVREGYSFEGWFDNSDLEGDAVTSIGQGTIGSKTYFAKWKENTPVTPPDSSSDSSTDSGISDSSSDSVTSSDTASDTAGSSDSKTSVSDSGSVDSGCGSVIGSMFGITGVLAAGAVAIAAKRKKD